MADAIQSPTAERDTSQAIFNLSGQRLTAPQRDVNIVAGRKMVKY